LRDLNKTFPHFNWVPKVHPPNPTWPITYDPSIEVTLRPKKAPGPLLQRGTC
jgi:hypothetical protein